MKLKTIFLISIMNVYSYANTNSICEKVFTEKEVKHYLDQYQERITDIKDLNKEIESDHSKLVKIRENLIRERDDANSFWSWLFGTRHKKALAYSGGLDSFNSKNKKRIKDINEINALESQAKLLLENIIFEAKVVVDANKSFKEALEQEAQNIKVSMIKLNYLLSKIKSELDKQDLMVKDYLAYKEIKVSPERIQRIENEVNFLSSRTALTEADIIFYENVLRTLKDSAGYIKDRDFLAYEQYFYLDFRISAESVLRTSIINYLNSINE